MISRLLVIPPMLLLLLLWLAPVLLLILAFRLRQKRSQPEITDQTPLRRGLLYLQANVSWLLTLAGSGLLVLFLLDLTIASYGEAVHHSETLRYQVTLPSESTLSVENVSFVGGDDLRLAAWFVPSQNGVTLILLHGYDGSRLDMLWHAETLVKAGFGVLLYDARATVESEGEYRSLGWQDPSDVAGAIAYLSQRPEVNSDQIGMVACSAGGQVALRSAAAFPEIDAVWADGPAPARAADYDETDYWLNDYYMLLAHFSDGMMSRRLDIAMPPPVSEVIAAIAPRPIMMLAGTRNDLEVARIEYYAKLAGDNADVWLVPEGYHCDGDELYPDEYAARMVDFFTTAFALEHE